MAISSMGMLKPSAAPVQVQGLTLSSANPVVLMTASWSDEGVLLQDGKYWTRGDNEWGQLGYSTSASTSSTRTAKGAGTTIPPGDCSWTANQVTSFPSGLTVAIPANPQDDNTVTMGGGSPNDGQTMAILSNGHYYGWGNDTDGQLCNGTAENGRVQLTGSLNDFTSYLASERVPAPTEVASGGTTGYVLNSTPGTSGEGDAWSCGDNSYGQLGDGATRPTARRRSKPSRLATRRPSPPPRTKELSS